jgi:hypothetical protein
VTVNEESEVNIPEIMGIADEHSLKEAINDLGNRSLNRLRSVLKSGAELTRIEADGLVVSGGDAAKKKP